MRATTVDVDRSREARSAENTIGLGHKAGPPSTGVWKYAESGVPSCASFEDIQSRIVRLDGLVDRFFEFKKRT